MSDEISVRALEDARTAEEMRWYLRELERLRRSGRNVDHHARLCPCCGTGLKMRAIPFPDGDGVTVFICPRCSWNKQFPFAMDEAREPGQEFTPGVTGRNRGQVVVRIDATTGRIRKIEGL